MGRETLVRDPVGRCLDRESSKSSSTRGLSTNLYSGVGRPSKFILVGGCCYTYPN